MIWAGVLYGTPPYQRTSTMGNGVHEVADFGVPGEVRDVVVVGAGIAGASAARSLAASGMDVLLVDKATFPRHKVCGACLNLRSLATLKAAGLQETVAARGATPLLEAVIGAGGREARIPLPGGMAITRRTLDGLLVDAARGDGVTFQQGTTARLGPVRDSRRLVALATGGETHTVAARLVLAADGLPGRLMTRAGESESRVSSRARVGVGAVLQEAADAYEPGRIHMACGRPGYAGLVRAEDHQLVVAAALDSEFMRASGGPGLAVNYLLAQSHWPALAGAADIQWRGTPPLTRRATRLAADRVLVLGDAGGYVEPFTGEGMAWAFTSAADAVNLLQGHLDHDWAALGRAWERSRRRTMRRQRWLCHATARLLRSPRATRAVVNAFSWNPAVSRPFVRFINAEGRS